MILHDKAAASRKPEEKVIDYALVYACRFVGGLFMQRFFLFCSICFISFCAQAQSLENLAARVQVLEDREAIRQLIIDYGTYHDHRDYRSLSSLFAFNGVW